MEGRVIGLSRFDDRPKAEASSEGGFSLTEVIVASVVAILCVIGLAYSFGLGRGLIDRYGTARAAFAAVQARMDSLSTLPPTASAFDLGDHPDPPDPFVIDGFQYGTQSWTVAMEPDHWPGLKRVTCRVVLTQASFPDTVALSRVFSPR